MSDPAPLRSLLLADAEPLRRRFVAENLSADGLAVDTASTLVEARRRLTGRAPDALVLGPLQRPAEQLALVRELRADPIELPARPALAILCLGPGDGELAELRALRAGADDWTALPLRYPVLHARVLALLRRARATGPLRRVRVGELELSPAERLVELNGHPVELAKLEFELLARLATEPARVFSKQELLRDIWGLREAGLTRTLDSHACRLRTKLAAAGGRGWIQNVWGVGYRLRPAYERPAQDPSAA